tara:strand:+ start:104 stop:352 length:249 start_codon:yes stop_codon:yes gene_type:complete
MSENVFSCHTSGAKKPATCAGFLLRGAEHNLNVRLGLIMGTLDLQQVDDDGLDLFDSYREMAVANGVEEDDSVLALCRSWDN